MAQVGFTVSGRSGSARRSGLGARLPLRRLPEGSVCSTRYGGPATAHVTGTWAGRQVDAIYDRGNGCEIGRWNRLVPLLPDLGLWALGHA